LAVSFAVVSELELPSVVDPSLDSVVSVPVESVVSVDVVSVAVDDSVVSVLVGVPELSLESATVGSVTEAFVVVGAVVPSDELDSSLVSAEPSSSPQAVDSNSAANTR